MLTQVVPGKPLNKLMVTSQSRPPISVDDLTMEDAFINSRLGAFSIPQSLVYSSFVRVHTILSVCFIVRAEHMFGGAGTFCYTAFSPLFDVLEKGVKIPEYSITLSDRIHGGYLITSRRLDIKI